MLNSQGLTVYVDWVEDRNALKRELTSIDTAKVLTERIRQSKVILYVLTSTSNASVWTPWELGYAQALGKKIAILQLANEIKAPEYIGLYVEALIMDDIIQISEEKQKRPIEDWVRQ